jgi:hypothetical protein
MAKYRTAKASATAAIDWHELTGTDEVLEGMNGEFVVRTSQASRVAVGVIDPGVSTTAGAATVAGEALTVILGAAAANQTIWVQTPADQSVVFVEVDEVSEGPVIAAFA